MTTAKKYLKDIMKRANTLTGGELQEDIEKYYKKHVDVLNSDEYKDKLAKCISENLDDPEKLKTMLESLCKYKIKDFVVDLYKFPKNLKYISEQKCKENEYIFYTFIGIYILILIGIGILIKLVFFSEKKTLY